MKAKQDILKTSAPQILVVLGFLALIIIVAFTLNDTFTKKPYDLFGISGSAEVK